MAQAFRQFLDNRHGKANDYDGKFGTQCVDLFNFYNRDVVGAGFIGTPRTGGAQDIWKEPSAMRDKFYQKVGKGAKIQQGDVLVYDGTMPGSGGYGHVAIAMDSKPTVIEQVPGSVAYTKVANRNHLLGILRPKKFIKSGGKDMTPKLINRLYLYIAGKKPTQKEIDFHMKKSTPESLAGGFRTSNNILWEKLKKNLKKANSQLADTKKELKALKDKPPTVIEKEVVKIEEKIVEVPVPVGEEEAVKGFFSRLIDKLFNWSK